jgi:hypothetical protein
LTITLRPYQNDAADFLYDSDRAMILAVDGREYLILRCRGEAPILQSLPAVVAANDAAPVAAAAAEVAQ